MAIVVVSAAPDAPDVAGDDGEVFINAFHCFGKRVQQEIQSTNKLHLSSETGFAEMQRAETESRCKKSLHS